MTLGSLQALTWGTVMGAVVSALLLASVESGWPDISRWRRTDASRAPMTKPAAAHSRERAARPDSPDRPAHTTPTGR